ncbi:hypothetical protein [Prochlorococcus sp. MIT 1011]|uniref:hypothetical protein n=1 Tax=Prochlorococcus sp. MIT 1011 TaxID=3082520 RepID=UPI0039B53295
MKRIIISKLLGQILGIKFIPLNPFLTAFILSLTARPYYKKSFLFNKRRKKLFFIPKTLFLPDLINTFHEDDKELELWYISSEAIRQIANRYLPKELSEYNYNSNSDDINKRKIELKNHWIKSIKIFKFIFRPKAFLTCAFYYRDQRELGIASLENKIPFIALHKECIASPITREARLKVYKENSGKYTGTLITTQNKEEKDTLVNAGCALDSQVEVVGCPRFDPIINNSLDLSLINSYDVIFFYFTEFAYLPFYRDKPIWPEKVGSIPVNPWTWKKLHERFNNFVFQFTESNPSLNIALKIKHGESLAKQFIEKQMPSNLTIISTGEGREMAAKAKVISAFNTTTILEGLAARTPVIVPAFGEAALGSILQEIGTLNLGNAVSYASSESDFNRLILDKLKIKNDRYRDFNESEKVALNRYVGYNDGKSGRRVRNLVNKTINSYSK